MLPAVRKLMNARHPKSNSTRRSPANGRSERGSGTSSVSTRKAKKERKRRARKETSVAGCGRARRDRLGGAGPISRGKKMRVSREPKRLHSRARCLHGTPCPLFTRGGGGRNCHCLEMCLHRVEIRVRFGRATLAFIFPTFVFGNVNVPLLETRRSWNAPGFLGPRFRRLSRGSFHR